MALRFVTTEAKVRWDKVALDVVVGALFGDVVSNNYSGKATVVAVNTAGNTTWSRPWTRTRALRTGWCQPEGLRATGYPSLVRDVQLTHPFRRGVTGHSFTLGRLDGSGSHGTLADVLPDNR
jgi:hypothetical protein